jgi:selenocysteine lyase/cysteine desulfurase
MYDIETLRETEFPLSASEIYFNHAAISPLPQRTAHKVQWATAQLAIQPSTFFQDEVMPAGRQLQAEVAAWINAGSADEIVPVTTTSAALGAVARALPWQEGDNVLFCELEFPSNAFPWQALEREGVEVRQVPAIGGGLTLEGLLPLVDENTRLVAASAIQFFSGHRTDLAAIGAYCRERGILFVVDAIQAIGHMVFDVEAMNVDVLATGGQKSLLAMPGTGFLYVRKSLAERMSPYPLGPNAVVDYENWLDYDRTPRPGADRFGMGTPNAAGWFSVLESIRLLRELDVAQIEAHTTALAAQAIAMLRRLGYEVITPPGHGPIVTFDPRLDDAAADELVDYLAQHKVTVSKRWDAARKPYIRLSLHAYNTREELGRFEELLRDGIRK